MSSPNAPQSNRQHPVPQNIMDVQFKLVGDLTMRQFAYLFVLGILAYLAYLVVYGVFKWPAVVILVLLGLALAFVPVEERGLDEWIVNFFRAINSPTQKIWRKEPQLPTAFLYDSLAVVKQEMITLAPTSSRRKLEEYLRYKSDEGKEDPLDIPEKAYAMKVHQAYPRTSVSAPGEDVSVMLEEPLPAEKDVFQESLEEEEKIEDSKTEKTLVEDLRKDSSLQGTVGGKEVKTSLRVSSKSAPAKIIKGRAPDSDEFILPERFESKEAGFSYNPITPDMHSGRKFVNLVPSRGELILPIRGERTLETSEDLIVKENLDEKAKNLYELLDKIRREEGIGKDIIKKVIEPVASPEGNEEVPGIGTEAKGLAVELQQRNENLESEIQRLRNQIQRGKSMSLNTDTQEQLLKRLESQKEKIVSSYTDLRQQFEDLQKKLDEKETLVVTPDSSTKIARKIPILTNDPNVVTGVVRDSGGRLLGGVLLIIKNMRGEAVRAFKTNSLGQFIVSTPLQNGAYTVEVSPSNKTNLTFGIIPIEVKGEVIPPLDVVGK